jgi:arylsulfatase A-like enzyme
VLKLLPTGIAVTVALAVGIGAASPPAPQDSRPNIVVIMTDDQTAESLRVMGNVQRLLAAHGTSFSNSFVANSLCCPSRATFLTGQYSHNNGVWENGAPQGGYDALRPTHANTLPAWLQHAGYATVLLGKYLNDYGHDDPTEIPPGWSDWHGSIDPSTYQYDRYKLSENGVLRKYLEYQTDLYAQKAVDLIAQHARSPKPFFFWIAFLAPHDGKPNEPDDPPIDTPVPAPRHKDRFASEPLPSDPSFDEEDVSDKPEAIRRREHLSSTERAAIAENYRQRLETLLAVDEAVARIVAALARSGELNRTLIVFTSDNGYFFGEHRVKEGKRLLYEPSIRVPLIMRGPGAPQGITISKLVSNVDLAPTFVEVAHARAGRALDGRSLVPLLADPRRPWRRDLLVERGPASREPQDAYEALRTPRFMYAEYSNGEQELYDLARDPFELTSLHADPAYAQWRAELARRLARMRSCAGVACRT